MRLGGRGETGNEAGREGLGMRLGGGERLGMRLGGKDWE